MRPGRPGGSSGLEPAVGLCLGVSAVLSGAIGTQQILRPWVKGLPRADELAFVVVVF